MNLETRLERALEVIWNDSWDVETYIRNLRYIEFTKDDVKQHLIEVHDCYEDEYMEIVDEIYSEREF